MMTRETLSIDESNSLEFVSTLGQGGFGSVSLMRDSNFRLHAKKSSSLDQLMILAKELRIMKQFRNHPRIVQASIPDLQIETKPERCSIVMEFASKGTLHNMISEFRGRPMPENIIRHVALMILQGLIAFHSQGYVHCDIKPANVLVFPSNTIGERWNLKIADFGLSKEPGTDSSSFFGGTEPYMPPESFGPRRMISSAVDIWSLGCVVLEMFGGVPKKTMGVYTWKLPNLMPPLATDFLRRSFELHPSRRATASELLNHPFVTHRVVGTTPRAQMVPCLQRFPCVIKNNVMDESRRQGGMVMMMH